ncbi:hypothetical protein L1887_51868 [Cichorium endivia]|nr:hypothetical protein L1887_51868 [Cichorium endivia]
MMSDTWGRVEERSGTREDVAADGGVAGADVGVGVGLDDLLEQRSERLGEVVGKVGVLGKEHLLEAGEPVRLGGDVAGLGLGAYDESVDVSAEGLGGGECGEGGGVEGALLVLEEDERVGEVDARGGESATEGQRRRSGGAQADAREHGGGDHGGLGVQDIWWRRRTGAATRLRTQTRWAGRVTSAGSEQHLHSCICLSCLSAWLRFQRAARAALMRPGLSRRAFTRNCHPNARQAGRSKDYLMRVTASRLVSSKALTLTKYRFGLSVTLMTGMCGGFAECARTTMLCSLLPPPSPPHHRFDAP